MISLRFTHLSALQQFNIYLYTVIIKLTNQKKKKNIYTYMPWYQGLAIDMVEVLILYKLHSRWERTDVSNVLSRDNRGTVSIEIGGSTRVPSKFHFYLIKTYLQWLFDDRLAINIGTIVFIFHPWSSWRNKIRTSTFNRITHYSILFSPMLLIQVHAFPTLFPP